MLLSIIIVILSLKKLIIVTLRWCKRELGLILNHPLFWIFFLSFYAPLDSLFFIIIIILFSAPSYITKSPTSPYLSCHALWLLLLLHLIKLFFSFFFLTNNISFLRGNKEYFINIIFTIIFSFYFCLKLECINV